jgi:hypothetical protein
VRFHRNHVKLISYGSAAALIGSLLVGPPQSFAQDAESNASVPLRLTVAPQTSSRIAMKTLPKAVCVLHAEGDSDASHSFKLFSDDEGMIRFNVNPAQESDQVDAFAVDCTAEGQTRTFALELRASSVPSEDMPAPAAEVHTPQESDVIRPALTKEEALQLSDEELIKREYPVRPNASQAPGAFANWLQVVTKQARRVDSRQVAHPDLRGSSQAYTTNWSGWDLKNAPNEVPVSSYNLVEGEWYVPTVTAPTSEGTTYSVMWVGLDGDDGICPTYCPGNGGTSDLWQAGTGQQTHDILLGLGFGGAVRQYSISTYYAWTELLPTQGIEVMPNFNVYPGDEMYITVWVGNAGDNPSLSGAYGIAAVEDITRGEFTYVYTPRGNVNILGYQAEWIMERPYEYGVLPNLSDYNYAYMYAPYTELTDGSFLSYAQTYSQQLFMYGSTGDLLSGSYSFGPGEMYFKWYNFN